MRLKNENENLQESKKDQDSNPGQFSRKPESCSLR